MENRARFEQIDQRYEQIDRRFEQIDRRFVEVDQRFDEVLLEVRDNKREQDYLTKRLFRAEMELDNLREQLSGKQSDT